MYSDSSADITFTVRNFRGALFVMVVLAACGGPAEAASPQVQPSAAGGTLTSTGPMSQARFAHSATALDDGRVLIVGGTGSTTVTAAELYDPTQGMFTTIPGPAIPRSSHTATKLRDGSVIVIGGYGSDDSYLTSIERFDPESGQWHVVGHLLEARAGHVAVPLSDGRILVIGGVGTGWTFLASAELYDPATESSIATGSMSVARESHVAARLRDGNVLVIGGHAGRRAQMVLYASTELYDVASGTFHAAGEMQVPRHKHDAVLLHDGSVLVTGGADTRDSRGQYQSVERYDPETDHFRVMPPLALTRYKHAGTGIVLPDGTVLIAGGANAAERYDPVTGKTGVISGAADLPGLFSAVAPLPGGDVLVAGGYGHDVSGSNRAWRYRP